MRDMNDQMVDAQEVRLSGRKLRFQNLFNHDADNVGDQMCGPARYFDKTLFEQENFQGKVNLSQRVIFGGGQIFSQMLRLTHPEKTTSRQSFVCWGAGLPVRGKRDEDVRRLAARFDLFATRNFDWADAFDFVPCVSCLSPMFDDLPAPTHDVVIFAHQKKTPNLVAPADIPFRTNIGQSERSVLEFIASGETVVTSSYHGAYWAQLLGRKVVCIPYNEKFATFQHAPFFSTEQGWQGDLAKASQGHALLEEYRDLNLKFCDRVSELWG